MKNNRNVSVHPQMIYRFHLPNKTPHCRADAQRARTDDNPIVIRRAYDISTTCSRRNTAEEDAPMSLHIRGEQSSSLVRCVLIGAAAVGAAAAAGMLCKLHLRMKYRRRYAQRLKQMRIQMRAQQAKHPVSADRKASDTGAVC